MADLAVAQPRQPPGPKIEYGDVSGKLAAVRWPNANPGAVGRMDIQTSRGQKVSIKLDADSRVEVMHSALTSEQAQLFAVVGVQCQVWWKERRDSQTGGTLGWFAERILISAEWADGTAKNVTLEGADLMAVPHKERPDPQTDDRPPVRAARQAKNRPEPQEPPEGKEQQKPKPDKTKPPPAKPPKPKQLSVRFVAGVTQLTLDGKELEIKAWVEAWKQDRKIQIEALIVPGPKNRVVEWHGQSTDAVQADEPPPEEKKEKEDRQKRR